MMRFIILLFVLLIWYSLLPSCQSGGAKNMKDLDENMQDLKMYQENMGDELKEGRLADAEWLLTGLDSVLQVVADKFEEHRKLDRPFAYFYRKDLTGPLQTIRRGIERNDSALALGGYRLLVKRCNACHIDHEIDKEVRY